MTLDRHKYIFIKLAFCILIFSNQVLTGNCTDVISEDEFIEYFDELMIDYYHLFDTNFGTNFTLGRNYTAYITISTVYGSAIEFVPSNENKVYFKKTDKRIEHEAFPDLNFSITLPDPEATILSYDGDPGGNLIVIENNTATLKNMIIETNQGSFVSIEKKGTLFLSGITVDGRYYHFMIIRGDNTRNTWSEGQAKNDAASLFDNIIFYNEETVMNIKGYMAYPIFVELLTKLLWRQNNAMDIEYTLPQFYQEMNEVKQLAVNIFILQSSYVDDIFQWLEKITPKPIVLPEPPWYGKAPWDWVISGIIGTVIGIILTTVMQNYTSSRVKRPRKVKK